MEIWFDDVTWCPFPYFFSTYNGKKDNQKTAVLIPTYLILGSVYDSAPHIHGGKSSRYFYSLESGILGSKSVAKYRVIECHNGKSMIFPKKAK